jgi:hypothetical protein
MGKFWIRFVLFGGLLTMLTLAGPACADALLEVPLTAGEFTSVTYTGPDNASFTGTFGVFGAYAPGGGYLIPPNFELWGWRANGPFGTTICDQNAPGSCGIESDQVHWGLSDGITLFTMSISGGCYDEIAGSPACTVFTLSPYGWFDIDIPSANPGDLFLTDAPPTPTPLPPALPLFAAGLGALGLLGWRRKRKSPRYLASAETESG